MGKKWSGGWAQKVIVNKSYSISSVLFNIFISDLYSQALHSGVRWRTGDSGHKLKLEKFRLAIRKNLCVRTVRPWKRLPREVIQFCITTGFQDR